ncbi:MAG: hypothetical protein HG447_003800 [Prevotella sp.]|nr:hypothetical protein [Prevotella sp.]
MKSETSTFNNPVSSAPQTDTGTTNTPQSIDPIRVAQHIAEEYKTK